MPQLIKFKIIRIILRQSRYLDTHRPTNLAVYKFYLLKMTNHQLNRAMNEKKSVLAKFFITQL